MSVNTTYEITLIEPLTEHEFTFLEGMICGAGLETAMNANGRILLIEGDIEVDELIKMLAKAGYADDVGLIRQIVEYVPDRTMILLDFEPVND